jgi:hypothetical protein
MYHNNIKQTYDSAKSLVQGASDRVLLGVISLDTMLSNPLTAHAQRSLENANSSWDESAGMYTCIGLLFSSLSCLPFNSGRYNPKTGIKKIGLGVVGVGFCLAGLLKALYK